MSLGTPVNFGFSTAAGISNASWFDGKILLQNAEFSKGADEEPVRDGTGALVSRHFYNPHKKATLEYIPTGANLAGAKTNTTVPDVGTMINITAAPEMPDLVGSNWVVVGEPKVSGSNTAAKKISLNLEAHAGITQVAS